MLAVILGLAAVIFSVIIGGLVGQSQNPPTVTPGANDGASSCSALCAQLQARHAERCMAEADERSAEARLSSLNDQRTGFLVASAVALAAGFASLFIPFVGAAVAAGFFAAAAALGALALGLQGAILAAESDRAGKAAAARTGRQREAEARQMMIEKCPGEAAACLALVGSC